MLPPSALAEPIPDAAGGDLGETHAGYGFFGAYLGVALTVPVVAACIEVELVEERVPCILGSSLLVMLGASLGYSLGYAAHELEAPADLGDALGGFAVVGLTGFQIGYGLSTSFGEGASKSDSLLWGGAGGLLTGLSAAFFYSHWREGDVDAHSTRQAALLAGPLFEVLGTLIVGGIDLANGDDELSRPSIELIRGTTALVGIVGLTLLVEALR